MNALLSLGYTLVYNEIGSLLDGLGFDPYLGFYHQPRFGHATLASDLLEEFRVPLVDRFTLHLVNESYSTNGQSKGSCLGSLLGSFHCHLSMDL